MAVIKIIELIGVSSKSWEDAVNNAVKDASKTIDNITGVEVIHATAKVKDGAVTEYRADVKVAFVVTDR